MPPKRSPQSFTLIPAVAAAGISSNPEVAVALKTNLPEELPFLRWTLGPLNARGESTYAQVGIFDLEPLVLPLIDLDSTALQESPEATCLGPEAVGRILMGLKDAGMAGLVCSSLTQFLHEALQVKPRCEAAVFAVQKSDLLQLEQASDAADLPAESRFLRFTTWADWQSTHGLREASLRLSWFGPRAKLSVKAEAKGAFNSIALLVLRAFNKSSPLRDLSGVADELLGPQVAQWLVSLLYPVDLAEPARDLRQALAEFNKAVAFESGDSKKQSALVLAGLPLFLPRLHNLQMLLGPAVTMPRVTGPLLTLMGKFGLEARTPMIADLDALDVLLEDRLDLVQMIPDGDGASEARIKALITDTEAAARTDLQAFRGGATVGDQADGIFSLNVPSSQLPRLNLLRRSARLHTLVAALDMEMAKVEPSRNELFRMIFEAQLLGVTKFMCGLLGTLDLGDTFAELSRFRIHKLKHDTADPLCKYFATLLVAGEITKVPRLERFTLDPLFILQLLQGRWSEIDWEQRLVLDVNLVRSGRPLQPSFSRPRSVWFTDESLLRDLVPPMCTIMQALGFPDGGGAGVNVFNSMEDIISQVCEGYKHARNNASCAISVRKQATAMMHDAVRDAGRAWVAYMANTAPDAPFPVSQVPGDSVCDQALNSAMSTADTFVNIFADIPEVAAAVLGAARPQQDDSRPAESEYDGKQHRRQSKRERAPPEPGDGKPQKKRPSGGSGGDNRPTGLNADRLQARVDEARDTIYIGKMQWRLSKVKAAFAASDGDLCWPVCVSRHFDPESMCPTPNAPGHERGGQAHRFEEGVRRGVHSQPHKFMINPPPSKKAGN